MDQSRASETHSCSATTTAGDASNTCACAVCMPTRVPVPMYVHACTISKESWPHQSQASSFAPTTSYFGSPRSGCLQTIYGGPTRLLKRTLSLETLPKSQCSGRRSVFPGLTESESDAPLKLNDRKFFSLWRAISTPLPLPRNTP